VAPVIINVSQIEFHEGGNTIWIHGPEGGTILRIKVTGRITTEVCATSPITHCDLLVEGDATFCLAKKTKKTL